MTADYDGQVLVTRHFAEVTGRTLVRIDRADPRARISSELLADIVVDPTRYARLTAGALTLTDDHGHRFIYRVHLDQYDPTTRSFPMEWPD